jgi:hypothetical protein
MTASSIFLPFGWSQSNGTWTRAHCRPLPGGSHAVQLIAAVALRGPGLAAAPVGALSDEAQDDHRHRAETKWTKRTRSSQAHDGPSVYRLDGIVEDQRLACSGIRQPFCDQDPSDPLFAEGSGTSAPMPFIASALSAGISSGR